jgi:mono/diheme cytochrome c family protein
MAATDKTYRSQKGLDVVFGVSCFLLLATTVWMFVQDYNRDFKAVQRKFRDVESAMAERDMLDKLPDPNTVYALRQSVDEARAERDARKKEVAAKESDILKRRERQDDKKRLLKADYDSLMSYYNIDAEHWGWAPHGTPEREKRGKMLDADQKKLDELKKKLDQAEKDLDEIDADFKREVGTASQAEQADAAGEPKESVGTLGWAEHKLAKAVERLKAVTSDFDRYAKTTIQKSWGAGDTFRALPILDAFESPTKIKQIWLPELTIDYGGFRDVPRYDRCTTCHLAIDRGNYERDKLQAVSESGNVDKYVRQLEEKNDALRRLYRGDQAKTVLSALDGMLAALPETASENDPHQVLRLHIARARDAWKQQMTGRLNPVQEAENLHVLKQTLKLVEAEGGKVDEGDVKASLEEQRGKAEEMLARHEGNVTAVLETLQADALRPTRKVQQAAEMLKERKASGEKLGFNPDDLPTRTLPSNALAVGSIVFSVALLIAVVLGLLRQSVRLATAFSVAGLALAFVAAYFVDYRQPRLYATQSVPMTDGEVVQYAAHPRMDLFVDSNSAHPMEKFGCTICHAGQGSATDFLLAAHTPNDEAQLKKWAHEQGWHSSHFWDFPMLSKRFLEATCVKCHHQVTDLVRYGSREEAPKLLRGYNLVRENGCFGCHEIAGLKSGREVGPDLRLEPSPAVEWRSPAEQEKIKADPANPPGMMRKVGPSLRRLAEKTNEDWVRRWVANPRGFRPDTRMPHFYGQSNNTDDVLPPEQQGFPDVEISSIAHYLLAESKGFLKGQDTYRKDMLQGKDSLPDLQDRLARGPLSDKEFKTLLDLGKRFADLALMSAPTRAGAINELASRHRQLLERLQDLGKGKAVKGPKGRAAPAGEGEVGDAVKELADVTARLAASARPDTIAERLVDHDGVAIELPPPPKDAKASAERGRRLFTERGCLACHANEGTTKPAPGTPAVIGKANFGPELSRISAKIKPEAEGVEPRRWLIQWLLNPNIHFARTRMPVTFLKPQDAADVAEWLLSQKVSDWPGKEQGPRTPETKDLVRLARVYLAKAPGITSIEVDRYLPEDGRPAGIPKDRLKMMARDADERRLETSGEDGAVSDGDLKWYIGRKAISRLGCYGCHGIPGFEGAKPIGTTLNDWGKKDAERLAFEDAAIYVHEHYSIQDSRRTKQDVQKRIGELEEKAAQYLPAEEQDEYRKLLGQADGDDAQARRKVLRVKAERGLPGGDRKELADLRRRLEVQPRLRELEAQEEKDPKSLGARERKELEALRKLKLWDVSNGKPPYEALFYHALEHRTREGFLHQKLNEPRSYDYHRIRPWDDRLRMPQFKFARSRQLPGESDADYYTRLERDEAEAREAVMTFILGLVAEPIPLKYLHRPDADRTAEARGREVLERFNCAGCHQVRPGVYEFKSDNDTLQYLQESLNIAVRNAAGDHVFPNHNAWVGTAPTSDRFLALGVDPRSKGLPNPDDPESSKPALAVRLTDALRFHGPDRLPRDLPAASDLYIPPHRLVAKSDPYGGTFTELLANEQDGYLLSPRQTPAYKQRFEKKPADARSALPPPLVREGERVQPDWLYRFLLNPTPIRPESFMLLRMPRFNMSGDDSRALVNYFAAVAKTNNPGAGVTYPYLRIEQHDADYWRRRTKEYVRRLRGELEMSEDLRAIEAKPEDSRSAKEKEELARGRKAQAEISRRYEELLNKKNLSDEEKKELAGLRKTSKLEARAAEMTPTWDEQARKELAGVKGAKKAEMLNKRLAELRKRWEEEEAYAHDAYRLLTVKPSPCLGCHDVGRVKAEEQKGPNLALSAQRLRPEWTRQWIANPKRLFTYDTIMPQNFPHKPRADWDWQTLFVGSPEDQIRAARDALMDLQRLADMQAAPGATPAPANSGGKK